MYPLTEWTNAQVNERLCSLIDYGFFEEAVVASCQTIERVLKRYIVREINLQQRAVLPGSKKLVRIEDYVTVYNKTILAGASGKVVTLIQARDIAIRRLVEPADLQRSWNLLSKTSGVPHLQNAFDSVIGLNSWFIFKTDGGAKLGFDLDGSWLHYGLRNCRHKVIHGKHAPRALELEILAKWGIQAVKSLIDPLSGLPALIGWNCQSRIPSLRRQANAKSI